MTRDILVSMKPKWAELIYSGKKTDEIRKSRPRDADPRSRYYIYETGTGNITGFFRVTDFRYIYARELPDGKHLYNTFGICSCMKPDELYRYLYKSPKNNDGFAWHIFETFRFIEPHPLEDAGVNLPPQSWRYIRGVLPF